MANIVFTNLEEFKKEVEEYLRKRMFVLGQLLVNEIQDKIEEIDLYESGKFHQGIHSFIDSRGNISIESSVFYDIYLEYGTYGYWETYGTDKFPTVPHPKKRDMSPALKKSFPRGMQPFAVFRRVLWNTKLMEQKLGEALS